MIEFEKIFEVLKEYKGIIIIIVLSLFVANNFLRKTKIYQNYRKNKKRRGLIETVLLLVLVFGVILLF
jgi:hypothetical protein